MKMIENLKHASKILETISSKGKRRFDPFARRFDPFALMSLGSIYQEQGAYDRAIVCFEKALHLQPNQYSCSVHLAACYAALGRTSEARRAAKRVMELAPDFKVEDFITAGAKSMRAPINPKIFSEQLYLAGLPYAGLEEGLLKTVPGPVPIPPGPPTGFRRNRPTRPIWTIFAGYPNRKSDCSQQCSHAYSRLNIYQR